METEFKCNNSTINFKCCSITDSKAEVLVSSDNAGLQMSQGVSRAILDAGGEEIDHDLTKVTGADLGDVIVTSAGRLKQRYIFHCIADKRGSKRNADILPIIIDQTIGQCLQLMPLLGVSSIAFPAIGTGAIGLSMESVANAMLKAFASHLKKTNRGLNIEICLLSSEDVRIFAQLAKSDTDFTIVNVGSKDNKANAAAETIDVFISYCWRDQKFALSLCQHLDELKISYFIDRNEINGGDDHKETIIKALRRTKVVLFLSSAESNKSTYVRQEIANATEMRIPVIPLRIDMTPYADSILFDLINALYIDCTQGLDPKWDELKRHLQVKGVNKQNEVQL